MSVTRVPPARQEARGFSGPPVDCHHVKVGFDASFHQITARRDIGSDAKLVYAKLVSLRRLGLAWTQSQIGESLGLSRHMVWRALGDLTRVGLVGVVRIGLGRPNEYLLYGLDEQTLDGRAPKGRAPRVATPIGRKKRAERRG